MSTSPQAEPRRPSLSGWSVRQSGSSELVRAADRLDARLRCWLWVAAALIAVTTGSVDLAPAAQDRGEVRADAVRPLAAGAVRPVAAGAGMPVVPAPSSPVPSIDVQPAAVPPAGPAPGRPAPSPALPRDVRVRYEIAGPPTAGLVTFTSGQASPVTEATQVRLPWRKEFDASGGFVPSLTAQGAGPITCRITLNGELLSSVTTEGTTAVAICTGHALD